MNFRAKIIASSLLAGVPLTATIFPLSAAFAQGAQASGAGSAGPEIIVTARKTDESILEAPLSLTALPSERLEQAGVDNALDLATLTPNLDISGGIAGQLQGQISIRGISTLVRNIGLETGTSIYVDGVYLGRPENFDRQLLGVEQVEILRGPQGTAFGKNTIAGLIHIKTREPDQDLGGEIRVRGGNYDYAAVQAHANVPLAETLSVNGSVDYESRDGFYRHLSGGEDADSLDMLSWRAAMKWEPSANVKLLLRTDGLSDRGTPGFFQADRLAGFPAAFPSNRPLRVNNNRPNTLKRNALGFSLTGEIEFGEHRLTSITAYRESDYFAQLDDDQEQVDFAAADDFGDDVEMFSQEIRLDGTLGVLDYLLGVYYLDRSMRTSRQLALGTDLGVPMALPLTTNGTVDSEGWAVFGRVDWHVVDQLTLSAGVRYSNEDKRADFVQDDVTGFLVGFGFPDLAFSDRSDEDDISPTFSIAWEAADDVHFFARYARGFKSAAFNVDLAMSINGLSAEPERATTVEAGVKTRLLDRRVSFALTGFRTDFDDLQVSQIIGAGIVLNNAANATIYGLEFEGGARLTDMIMLEASVGLLDAEYDSFQACVGPASLGGGAADCSGNDLVLAPEFTAHGALVLEQEVGFGTLHGRVDVEHRSAVFFEPTNAPDFQGRARTLVNLRAGVDFDSWSLFLWGRNLGDQRYETYIDDRSAIGVLRTKAYGQPRTYGVTVSRRF